MKLYKNLFAMLLAAAAFTACGEQDAEDHVNGTADALGTYGNIYFLQTSYNVELEPTDPTVYQVPISREDSTNAVTVPITVTGSDVVKAADVEFAAGQATANVELSFSEAEVGTTYSVTLSAENVTYLTPCSFTVTRVKWNDAGFYYDESGQKVEGYANYTDDLLTTFFGVDNTTHPVKLQERDDRPGYFRLINAYGAGYAYNEDGDFDAANDYYIIIDATNPEQVYIPERCEQGTDYGYGNFIVYSMAGYYLEKGDEESAESYYGRYENGKITFPTDALLFGMANYNSGGLYSSNNNGAFCLVVNPDLNPYAADVTSDDFAWESVFDGSFTSAILNNVSSAELLKGSCVNTKDDCDKTFAATYGTAYKIANTYAEGYSLYFGVDSTGAITTPEVKQPIGIKAMGADVYATINAHESSFTEKIITLNITFTNKDGSIDYGTSDEVLSNITWTATATGAYTYLADLWGAGAVGTGLSLAKRDDMDDIYKIADWNEGIDLVFRWNQETNEVVVSQQFIGETYGDYGDIYIMELSWSGLDIEPMPSSYYDPATQTFHFYVIYFVSAGYIGYGEETFVLDNASAAKMQRSTAKSIRKRSVKGMKREYKFSNVKFGLKNTLKNPGQTMAF